MQQRMVSTHGCGIWSARQWLAWCLLVAASLSSFLYGLASQRQKANQTSSPPMQAAGFGNLDSTNRPVSTRKIIDVMPGDNVAAELPAEYDREQDTSLGLEIDPPNWRLLTLKASKTDGSYADVWLLRPLWWLEEQDARVGALIDIEVPECGIDGDAQVLRIDPCPPIKAGWGRTVTGKFRHHSAHVIDLTIEGEPETIGTTPNHPFWSEDRKDFVLAGELQIGERLLNAKGQTARLTNVQPRAEPSEVYNLEVRLDHVYHVGALGLLVHNGRACTPIEFQINGETVAEDVSSGTKRAARYLSRLEGETARRTARVLQSDSRTIRASTAEALRLERDKLKEAIESIKKANNIPRNVHDIEILEGGDVLSKRTGQWLGNVYH